MVDDTFVLCERGIDKVWSFFTMIQSIRSNGGVVVWSLWFLLHLAVVVARTAPVLGWIVPSTFTTCSSSSSSSSSITLQRQQQQRQQQRQRQHWRPLFSSENNELSVFDSIQKRFACTRFQRFDKIKETTSEASVGNPTIIEKALECLDWARRAPSGFNAQPYKLLLVSSPQAKAAMAQYCIGRNAHRVRDSDCTVLFLADRQVVQTLFAEYGKLLDNKLKGWKLRKVQLLIAMFSSGFPFPKWLSGPISFGMRFAMRVVSWITRGWFPVPTLSSSEAWSQKNTMLVAMSYLLACTSQNVATCPMEGYQSWGIRRVLQIPRRYTIPLIVATGTPYIRNQTQQEGTDDAGMTHGTTKDTATPRYPKETMIYQNVFGQS